jgi:uncharacterized protein
MINNSLPEEVKQYVERSILCWLATSTPEGMPNVSPKEIFTHHTDKIIIAQIASPKSVKNIQANPQVCVSFIDIFIQKGYKINGTATVLGGESALFELYYDNLYQLAGPDFPIHSIIEIHPTDVSPIVAPRYRLFPETTESTQVKNAMKMYQVSKLR